MKAFEGSHNRLFFERANVTGKGCAKLVQGGFMQQDLEAVKRLAKDLNHEEPRSPEQQLGGYPFAARCLDKCRATLVGTQGDFTYGCPMDQKFLNAAGIGAEDFKGFVASGASDPEVGQWIEEHAHKGVGVDD
jgi:hypothetical protein